MAAYENAVSNSDREHNKAEETTSVAAQAATSRTAGTVQEKGRAARPDLSRRESISEFSDYEFDEMVDWINSDGKLRTDEEVIEELVPEMGFHRRGTRIEARIKEALVRARARGWLAFALSVLCGSSLQSRGMRGPSVNARTRAASWDARPTACMSWLKP